MIATHPKSRRAVLADNSGETLVETLVAVLISSLAMLMLAMAITTSVNIVRSGKNSIEDYTSKERELATVTGVSGTDEDSVAISVTGVTGTDSVTVKYVFEDNLPGLPHGITVVSYKPV